MHINPDLLPSHFSVRLASAIKGASCSCCEHGASPSVPCELSSLNMDVGVSEVPWALFARYTRPPHSCAWQQVVSHEAAFELNEH
jgi:hypothetical protein